MKLIRDFIILTLLGLLVLYCLFLLVFVLFLCIILYFCLCILFLTPLLLERNNNFIVLKFASVGQQGKRLTLKLILLFRVMMMSQQSYQLRWTLTQNYRCSDEVTFEPTCVILHPHCTTLLDECERPFPYNRDLPPDVTCHMTADGLPGNHSYDGMYQLKPPGSNYFRSVVCT